MWELLSSLSSLAHVMGTVQAVFYGVPDPTGQVGRLLETCETGGTRQRQHRHLCNSHRTSSSSAVRLG